MKAIFSHMISGQGRMGLHSGVTADVTGPDGGPFRVILTRDGMTLGEVQGVNSQFTLEVELPDPAPPAPPPPVVVEDAAGVPSSATIN